jgi:predicted Zn-dependent protease
VRELLVAKPNDAVALNLRAAVEIAMNRTKNAETILDQAIMHNPRSYYAYYNMARLKLRTKGNEESARRYYETGRAMGGPVDASLEVLLK